MKVNILFENGVNGAIQIGNMAKSTENGRASFDVEPGEYQIRGMALGYRGTVKTVSVETDEQTFTIDVRGD